LIDELDARNIDNVSRTASYLELYAQCRLPWLLMAHLVSRNAGYLMSDLARTRDHPKTLPSAQPMILQTFHMLERANWLIFWDAWHHVNCHLLGREQTRASPFMREAWKRYEASHDETALVYDLVQNEQTLIEHRVVHAPELMFARLLISMTELMGKDAPLHFPGADVQIRVGWFSSLDKRIEAGRRIFDEVVCDQRDALFQWCCAHPHTGSRAVYGGRAGVTVREGWPVSDVEARFPGIHAI
jgi:hypothetical protein